MPLPRTKKGEAQPPQSVDDRTDAKKNRFLAVMAYCWVLCVIPLVAKKGSPYAQFHAKQGVVVAFAWFILWLLAWIPLFNVLIAFPAMVVLIAVNILAVIRAWNGEKWKIPYLHDYVAVMNL